MEDHELSVALTLGNMKYTRQKASFLELLFIWLMINKPHYRYVQYKFEIKNELDILSRYH